MAFGKAQAADGVVPGVRAAERMPWWLWPNLLALDAPVVAVVWQQAFARAFGGTVGWPVATVLFLAVWSVYLVDRWFDARRLVDEQSATLRHRFARRHRRIFPAGALVTGLVGGVLACSMLGPRLLMAGAILAMVVAAYFGLFVCSFRGGKVPTAKEVACGLVFALGCALGVDAVRLDWWGALPLVGLFGGLCTLNCLAISTWEKSADASNDPAAASRWWRSLPRDLPLIGMALAGACCLLLLDFALVREGGPGAGRSVFVLAVLLSTVALMILHASSRLHGPLREEQHGARLRRVLADAVLLTPLLFG